MSEVWITRAERGAAATARAVAALGFEAVVAPLVEIHPLSAKIDLAGVGALAFTSAAGVAAFAGASPERAVPVFAVGAATARAARALDFAKVESANGDVADLARLIIERRGGLSGSVLHPGPRKAAGNLAGDLGDAGIAARSVALYQTRPAVLPKSVAARMSEFVGVLLHSPSAARALAALGPPAGLRAICLSKAVAAPLDGLELDVRVAERPNEASLLALLPPAPK